MASLVSVNFGRTFEIYADSQIFVMSIRTFFGNRPQLNRSQIEPEVAGGAVAGSNVVNSAHSHGVGQKLAVGQPVIYSLMITITISKNIQFR
jgi:hypothetical protein